MTKLSPVRRSNIPLWLDNKELPAPCICGRELPGVPTKVLEEVSTGLHRKFHVPCFMQLVEEQMENGELNMGDDDDDNLI